MILLVNPRATSWRARIPLSVLSIGASLEGTYHYRILDGNLDPHLTQTVTDILRDESLKYVGITVMPGPQLTEAILLSREIRLRYPRVKIVWGGYFPSLHPNVVLQSNYVDYVIRDQGDYSFVRLIDTLERDADVSTLKGISFKDSSSSVVHTPPQELIDPNTLPPLPYHRVNVPRYIGRTYLGTRTVNYHSSVGCPFLCGFCAVAASYKARWAGLEPARMARDILWFKDTFAVNAVEFHDNNFFTSERRTYDFCERIRGSDITWWGEARPDTVLHYDDSTWKLMRQAGCKAIFFGAESSSQEILDLMRKGGTQTPDTVLSLVTKMRTHGIVPELSFVFGTPSATIEEDVERDIGYIKEIKKLNPDTEIIIYVYSPVAFSEAELFQLATKNGFQYPERLDDWLLPEWRMHDLRKYPVAPWLTRGIQKRIKNFERILHAAFPTVSDLKLKPYQRLVLRILGGWRYRYSVYDAPYEVVFAQRLFRYRQPEIEGF